MKEKALPIDLIELSLTQSRVVAMESGASILNTP
jgi:hypothetical protein